MRNDRPGMAALIAALAEATAGVAVRAASTTPCGCSVKYWRTSLAEVAR